MRESCVCDLWTELLMLYTGSWFWRGVKVRFAKYTDTNLINQIDVFIIVSLSRKGYVVNSHCYGGSQHTCLYGVRG